jgi:hypothetical protein
VRLDAMLARIDRKRDVGRFSPEQDTVELELQTGRGVLRRNEDEAAEPRLESHDVLARFPSTIRP